MSQRSTGSMAPVARRREQRLRPCRPARTPRRCGLRRRSGRRGWSPSAHSSAARSYAASAATYPPPRWARDPTSSRRPTSSGVRSLGGGGPVPGLPVRFPRRASASARARWARRRSWPVAAWWIAERTSGWRSRDEPPVSTSSPESSAASSAPSPSPSRRGSRAARRLARVVGGREQQHPLHRLRAADGCGPGRPARRGRCRWQRATAGWTPRAGRGVSSPGSSSRASGLPPVSATSRSTTSSAGRVRPRGQEGARGPGSRPVRTTSDEPGRVERSPGPVARGEDHRDPVGAQPAGAEQQGSRRRGVQPVRVVDDAQDQVLLGRGGQQRQGRHPDQEGLDRRAVVLPERHPQRPGLRGWQSRAQPGQRAAAAGAGPRTPAAPRPRTPGRAARSPRRPRPASVSSSADLPTPGSPRTTTAPAVPCRARSTSAPRSARSGSRPTSTARTYTGAGPRTRRRPGWSGRVDGGGGRAAGGRQRAGRQAGSGWAGPLSAGAGRHPWPRGWPASGAGRGPRSRRPPPRRPRSRAPGRQPPRRPW